MFPSHGCDILTRWVRRFEQSGCVIKHIRNIGEVIVQGNVYKRLVSITFRSPEGQTIERSILLGLDAVVIVPIFFKGENPYFVTVEQRRVVDGCLSIEFPSGGVHSSLLPVESAREELREEAGVALPLDRLKILSDPLKVCESSLSETVYWYYCILEDEEIPTDGEASGVASENEHIVIRVLSYSELESVNSFHMVSACELLRRNFLIPI